MKFDFFTGFFGAGLGAAPPLAGAGFFLGLGAVAGIVMQVGVEVKITPDASAKLPPATHASGAAVGGLGFLFWCRELLSCLDLSPQFSIPLR